MGTMNGDTMTFPALTLPTTAPMTDNALKQRAAQKLATDLAQGPLPIRPSKVRRKLPHVAAELIGERDSRRRACEAFAGRSAGKRRNQDPVSHRWDKCVSKPAVRYKRYQIDDGRHRGDTERTYGGEATVGSLFDTMRRSWPSSSHDKR